MGGSGNTRPEVVKSLPYPATVQNGNLAVHSGSCLAGGPSGFPGSVGSLSPCAHPPQTQVLSPILLWVPSCLLGSFFWAHGSAKGFHKDLSSSSSSPSPAGVVPLDDILIQSFSQVQAHRDVQLTVQSLQVLGFVLNFAKSSLLPAQKHLGLQLNMNIFQFSHTQERQVCWL